MSKNTMPKYVSYDAISVANHFIALSVQDNSPVDALKLQKLVYYAVGWYAGYRHENLIFEDIKAWKFGPVIVSLYYALKPMGLKKITSFIDENNFPSIEDKNVCDFLDNIWKNYHAFSNTQLSTFTLCESSPWGQTKAQDAQQNIIDFSLMLSHFKKAVEAIKIDSQSQLTQKLKVIL